MLSSTFIGCSTIDKNDSRIENYFLRKKYLITRIYETDLSMNIGSEYFTPSEFSIVSENTYVDFYYGGYDYIKANAPRFIFSMSFRSTPSPVKKKNCNPVIGEYLINKKENYDMPVYISFENADLFLMKESYDSTYKKYKNISFPDFYVRIFMYFESAETSEIKYYCFEFGNPIVVHSIEETPIMGS